MTLRELTMATTIVFHKKLEAFSETQKALTADATDTDIENFNKSFYGLYEFVLSNLIKNYDARNDTDNDKMKLINEVCAAINEKNEKLAGN